MSITEYVTYCDYYDDSRCDPAFYTWDSPEWVATVRVDDKSLELWTVGEMRINMPNEDILRYADDLLHAGITTDEHLYALDDIYGDVWINNSWFELRDYEGQWIGDVWSGHVYHHVTEGVQACFALLKDEEFLSEYPCKNPDFVVGSAHE